MKSLSASGTIMEPIDLQAIQTKNVTKQICERCGSRHAKLCPAIGAECRKCGRKNHFAKLCRTRMTIETKPPYHTMQHFYRRRFVIEGIQRNQKVRDWKLQLLLTTKRLLLR